MFVVTAHTPHIPPLSHCTAVWAWTDDMWALWSNGHEGCQDAVTCVPDVCGQLWEFALHVQVGDELVQAARAGLASGHGWLLRARAGLCQLLRARVAPAQRQATMQLCAAVSAVGRSQWLLASSRNVVRPGPEHEKILPGILSTDSPAAWM